MNKIYVVGNINPTEIKVYALLSMLFFILGIIFDIASVKVKNDKIFKVLARIEYMCAILLLIFWGTFLIINQTNGILEYLE